MQLPVGHGCGGTGHPAVCYVTLVGDARSQVLSVLSA